MLLPLIFPLDPQWPPHVFHSRIATDLRSFGSKWTVLKKVLVILLGLFGTPRSHSAPSAVIWRPHSDSAPGELRPPSPPSLRLWCLHGCAIACMLKEIFAQCKREHCLRGSTACVTHSWTSSAGFRRWGLGPRCGGKPHVRIQNL